MTTLPVANVGYIARKPQAPNVAAAYRRGAVWQCLRVWVLVLLLAQGLLGVRADAKEQGLDHTAITLAEAALQRDPYVERYEVIVSVVNGKVYLSGVVDSRFEEDQAEDVASRVAGVIAVDNNITVASTPPLKSDWEIRQDIRDELRWSPYVDSDAIAVSVKDGVATLRGLVGDWAEQRAAIENACEGGALSVRDELAVKGNSAD
jgi:osmotically-inducible protein OsmY